MGRFGRSGRQTGRRHLCECVWPASGANFSNEFNRRPRLAVDQTVLAHFLFLSLSLSRRPTDLLLIHSARTGAIDSAIITLELVKLIFRSLARRGPNFCARSLACLLAPKPEQPLAPIVVAVLLSSLWPTTWPSVGASAAPLPARRARPLLGRKFPISTRRFAPLPAGRNSSVWLWRTSAALGRPAAHHMGRNFGDFCWVCSRATQFDWAELSWPELS